MTTLEAFTKTEQDLARAKRRIQKCLERKLRPKDNVTTHVLIAKINEAIGSVWDAHKEMRGLP